MLFSGSFSIQVRTSSSSLWRRAHFGSAGSRRTRKKRVRVRSNEEQRQQQGSSSERPTFKQISKGIKAAFGVFQGWKVVQKVQVASPLVGLGAGDWVMWSVKATKFFAKGFKVSQKVLTSALFSQLTFKRHPAGATTDLASLAKGFNAVYAAIKIVQFTNGLGRQPQEVSLWKGYKFSKSLLTFLDPVVGKNAGKGFLVLKTTVGGIGVVVKAALLSKELCIALLQKLAISGGTFASSLRTGYQRNHIEMIVNRSHQSKPTSMAITKEGDFCNLLSASFPHSSLSNDLFKSFPEDTESPVVKFCEDDRHFIIFCLAIPSEILVFV